MELKEAIKKVQKLSESEFIDYETRKALKIVLNNQKNGDYDVKIFKDPDKYNTKFKTGADELPINLENDNSNPEKW